MAQFCVFLGKTPTDLAKEHQEDLRMDVLERSNIAKRQLNAFFGYLTDTNDSKFKNKLNDKRIENPIAWNSARQYVYSKLLSFYKRLGVPVVYGRNEKPHKEDKNINEKVWRKNNTKEVVKNEKTILKQIRDSFNSLRDKSVFLGKISSSLDDVDMFNLKIKDYIEGYISEYGICYLQGNRQKDRVLFQTFFGIEACEMIQLYLTERLEKINNKRKNENKKSLKNLPKNEYLFTTTTNEQMKPRYFTEKMRDVTDMLNLYNITPKSLRRFFKTTLQTNSINAGFIRRMMGHIGETSDTYNMLFEQAKEGVRNGIAKDYFENVNPLISLGNGGYKISKIDKEISELKEFNKNLVVQLNKSNEKTNLLEKTVDLLLEYIKPKNTRESLERYLEKIENNEEARQEVMQSLKGREEDLELYIEDQKSDIKHLKELEKLTSK